MLYKHFSTSQIVFLPQQPSVSRKHVEKEAEGEKLAAWVEDQNLKIKNVS